MGEPFVGEIRMFGGNFAPAGWAFCQGQLMPIAENDTLFTLIGTTYGGDGQQTFGLPDLQGRIPVHAGTGNDGITYQIGEKGGVESVTLTTSQIPAHTHVPIATTDAGTLSSPANATWAAAGTGEQLYSTPPNPPASAMNAQGILPTGGSQPHENIAPYLAISFIISLFGVFPSQT
jgi:microcystin-dependent protein